MNPVATAQKMTADEFFEWVHRPENEGKLWELVRGEVEEMSLPGERHGFVCLRVGMRLMVYADQQGKGYPVDTEVGVLLERDPDTVRGPDIMHFDKGKRFDELNPKWIEDVPALAVEVLSPNDRPNKLLRRVEEFFRSGIRMVWVVDPETCDVAVYRPGMQPRLFGSTQDLDGEDVLPGYRCKVSDFFFMPGEEPGQEGGKQQGVSEAPNVS